MCVCAWESIFYPMLFMCLLVTLLKRQLSFNKNWFWLVSISMISVLYFIVRIINMHIICCLLLFGCCFFYFFVNQYYLKYLFKFICFILLAIFLMKRLYTSLLIKSSTKRWKCWTFLFIYLCIWALCLVAVSIFLFVNLLLLGLRIVYDVCVFFLYFLLQ